MATIFHLSDLHLDPRRGPEQAALLANLGAALGQTARRVCPDPAAPRLVVITGDLFQTSTLLAAEALREFAGLRAALAAALGESTPILLVPGNHDCRASGVFGPHEPTLFAGARAQSPHIRGPLAPERMVVAPPAWHGLPATVAGLDSTFLPFGKFGAGGTLAAPDILALGRHVLAAPPGAPVILAAHHHFVPTPITDVSEIDTSQEWAPKRWLVRSVLPRLVANANYEEFFMTALGAGTALSILHTFERPVLVLHGHKHYPAVRLLRGLGSGEGDVLLAGAGSSGTVEKIGQQTAADDATSDPGAQAYLWPSFNVVTWAEGGPLAVECVRFAPWAGAAPADAPNVALRHHALVAVQAAGARWEPTGGAPEGQESAAELAESHAHYELGAPSGARADLRCTRQLRFARATGTAAEPPRDLIKGPPGAVVSHGARHAAPPVALPFTAAAGDRFELQYQVLHGICTTADEARSAYGPHAGHEYVGLLVRGRTGEASLTVRGIDPARAFAGVADLGRGIERPAALRVVDEATVQVRVANCGPRHRLRIYWPFDALRPPVA